MRSAMLGLRSITTAILRNQAHRARLTPTLRKLRGLAAVRAGRDWLHQRTEVTGRNVLKTWNVLGAALGDVRGLTGIEIGPGDNAGLAYCLLRSGAARIHTIDKHATIDLSDAKQRDLLAWLNGHVEGPDGAGERLCVHSGRFEDLALPEPVDFVYSNDVLEHVDDVANVCRKAGELLKPGGLFVNNVDLAGHNAYHNPRRPLDFLCCPDWLWGLMFSHIVGVNRARCGDIEQALAAGGFRVTSVKRLKGADDSYVQALRPHLRAKYRKLPLKDLCALQVLIAATRR